MPPTPVKMMPPKAPPAPVKPQPAPTVKCIVKDQPDGCMVVEFLIEADVATRIRRRANGMPMDRYIWENILHRAVVDSVY